MGLYNVTVYSRLREIYEVEADSAKEAERTWYDTDPYVSEVEWIEDIFVDKGEDDD